MYKLLIVDDEKIEREGMAELIPWGSYGIELAGTAWNGQDGYEQVLKVHPDIVMTDIKMPVMDGLELIRRLKEEFPDIEVIVLSGYGEYEYTSQAMELGIKYYILKPCDEERMLPVIEKVKEAGVVDSGGQGLMEVLQGIVDALTGKVTEIEVPAEAASMSSAVISAPKADISTADIKFGYCTEFIILLDKPLTKEEEKGLKKFFLSIGDSLVLVADEEICKVHVHTNHPGQAFEKALTFGALSNMKIDNMRLEHQEKLIKDAENEAARQRQQEAEEEKLTAQEAAKAQPAKEVGFIAVSAGEGLTDIFKGLGVDYLIEGGQTMNPSTEDMLNAIDQVNAKNIFILPNNKNIILAAEQARDLTEDKKIVVLPTKTIPQGISAMIGYMPEASVDENAENMKDAYQDIASGQVTYAVRDTSIDGKEIHNGDIMGINDGGIAAVGKDLMETTIDLLSTMVDEDSELICLYYGADVSKQDADVLSDEIEEKFPECEVEVNFGGQPIYYYMISVE